MKNPEFRGNPLNLKRENGLTLIELLVTIIILSFVIVLISGALNQTSRIIQTAASQNIGFMERWNQTRAMYDIIENMVIDPLEEIPFSGTEKTIHLTTAAPPDKPRGIPQRIELILISDQNSSILSFQSEPKKEKKLITKFSGLVFFRFTDHQGNNHTTWPPNGFDQFKEMPSSIALIKKNDQSEIVKLIANQGSLNSPKKKMSDFFSPTP